MNSYDPDVSTIATHRVTNDRFKCADSISSVPGAFDSNLYKVLSRVSFHFLIRNLNASVFVYSLGKQISVMYYTLKKT